MTESVPAPRILLATATIWPTSARLAHRFIRAGCEVSAVCPPAHALERVRGIGRIYHYTSVRSYAALRHALAHSKADYVFPCNDGVVWQLQIIYWRHPELRPVIERSLGDPEKFNIVRSRFHLLDAAQRLGIRIPRTLPVDSEDDIRAWYRNAPEGQAPEIAVKVDGAWGGIGVKLVSSEVRAIKAYHAFTRKPSTAAVIKRIIDRDPLAFWNWRHSGKPGISAQEFIEGRPANSMVACHNGKVLAALHVEVLCALGATKAAISVRKIQHPEMQRACELIAAEFKLTGFFGLDYILDPATGRTWLIELNPRATQIGHLEWLDDDTCLADAMAAELTGRPALPPVKPIPKDAMILLFPQALACDLNSPWLCDGLHDLPFDQPEIMRDFNPGRTGPQNLMQFLYSLLKKNSASRPVIFSDTGMISADDSTP